MKKLIVALATFFIILACADKHTDLSAVPAPLPEYKIAVYAVYDEDIDTLGSYLSESDECYRSVLRSRLISLSDTARVNSILHEHDTLMDSLGLCTAWVVSADTTATNLMVFRSSPLLSETLHEAAMDKSPGINDNTIVSLKFHNVHDWQNITTELQGHHLVISLNGDIVDATLVNAPVEDGYCSFVLPADKAEKLFGEIVSEY